ncbi:MAG: radical SAM protein [Cyanobacteriota/Melainabacteria group bacterium]
MTGVNLGRSMPILASRGCPYQCTFCSNPVMWGRLWSPRPPADVIAEMEDYIERYQATNFDFYDLTAIVRKDWIVEFTNLVIEKNLNITWQLPSGTRSEAIDSEVTALLYKSGCRYINYAPESGSEAVLQRIKKVINKDRMVESMRSAIKNGMKVKGNFILGFPGETYREVLDTYIFLIKLAVIGVHDVSVFPFTPYPGSSLFKELQEKGVIKLDDDYLYALSQYTDMWIPPKSYSDHISDRALGFLTLFAMLMFFGISFLSRPVRFISLVYNLCTRQPQTKLEAALDRIIEKRFILVNASSQS